MSTIYEPNLQTIVSAVSESPCSSKRIFDYANHIAKGDSPAWKPSLCSPSDSSMFLALKPLPACIDFSVSLQVRTAWFRIVLTESTVQLSIPRIKVNSNEFLRTSSSFIMDPSISITTLILLPFLNTLVPLLPTSSKTPHTGSATFHSQFQCSSASQY